MVDAQTNRDAAYTGAASGVHGKFSPLLSIAVRALCPSVSLSLSVSRAPPWLTPVVRDCISPASSAPCFRSGLSATTTYNTPRARSSTFLLIIDRSTFSLSSRGLPHTWPTAVGKASAAQVSRHMARAREIMRVCVCARDRPIWQDCCCIATRIACPLTGAGASLSLSLSLSLSRSLARSLPPHSLSRSLPPLPPSLSPPLSCVSLSQLHSSHDERPRFYSCTTSHSTSCSLRC